MSNRYDDSGEYNGVKYTYAVYEDNGVWGGDGIVHLATDKVNQDVMLTLDNDYEASSEAKDAIIKSCEACIRNYMRTE